MGGASDTALAFMDNFRVAENLGVIVRLLESKSRVRRLLRLQVRDSFPWDYNDAQRMGLTSGTKLGPYEIVSPLGAGGMGEVYRARDAKLGREVALKVLPEALARDAERTGRFEREAKVLASLNHPNIAAIYGFEDSSGVHALVMELVEGSTLVDRIAKSPIPLTDALPIAKQICEALEYAHERGIVHRDLKPANVKITSMVR